MRKALAHVSAEELMNMAGITLDELKGRIKLSDGVELRAVGDVPGRSGTMMKFNGPGLPPECETPEATVIPTIPLSDIFKDP